MVGNVQGPLSRSGGSCACDAKASVVLSRVALEAYQVTRTRQLWPLAHGDQLADYILRLGEPLVLTPELDESQQLMCLVYPSLGVDVCALTRDELDEALVLEIDGLWRNYAKADDGELTPAATELKRGLLARMDYVVRADR